MSAWKSTLLLPTLFQTAHRSRPVRTAQSGAGTRPASEVRRYPEDPDRVSPPPSDLCGQWSLDRRYGEDLHVIVETWFAADGGFETRTYLDCRGDVERLHACGTWALKRGGFVTMPSPTECRSLGDVTGGCGESTSESLTLEVREGVKTLLLDLGEVMGAFVSPRKAFTLPDLFKGGVCNRNVTQGASYLSAFHPGYAESCNRAA